MAKKRKEQAPMFTEEEVLPLWTMGALPVSAEDLACSRNAARMMLQALRSGKPYPAPADTDGAAGKPEVSHD